MNLQEIIGSNIRTAREDAGLSQSEVAGKLGLASHSAVSDIESGRRRLSATELMELGGMLGKPVEWFFDADASREDFVTLARAQATPEDVRQALKEVETLCANYLLLKKLLQG